MMRFEIPYEAKSSELTPAIPSSGLAIPKQVQDISFTMVAGGRMFTLVQRKEPFVS